MPRSKTKPVLSAVEGPVLSAVEGAGLMPPGSAFRLLHSVGFPRRYNVSGVNHAACILAPPVLHTSPHGFTRSICSRLADGR